MALLEALVETDPVTSSNLVSIGYSADRRVLAVWLKSGDLYHYHDVAPPVWNAFQAASSKGTFYGTVIRGKFRGVKMTGHCPKCGAKGIVGIPCEDCGCADVVADPMKPPRWTKQIDAATDRDIDLQVQRLAEHFDPDPRD